MSTPKDGCISIPLYILVIVFNISSWIDIDALWAELPLLVNRLPEYWALPSYLLLICDATAIFPIIYNLGSKYKPRIFREVPIIFIVIGTGFLGSVLQIFFWHKTVVIGGEPRSLAFLCLCFFLSTVDSTSTVAFLAYLARLPEAYVSAFFVGEGLCGFIPSVFAFLQGAGEYECVNATIPSPINDSTYNDDIGIELKNASQTLSVYNFSRENLTWQVEAVLRDPLFSIEAFLSIVSTILAFSFLSFALINFHPWCKKHHVSSGDTDNYNDDNKKRDNGTKQAFLKGNRNEDEANETDTEAEGKDKLPFWEYVLIASQYGVQYGMQYGVLYPLQTYSLLPYGNLTFSLGNRLNRVLLPISSFVAYIFPTRSTKVVTCITFLGLVPSVYIILLAALSPYPPMKDTVAGPVLAVSAWLVMTVLWGYVKVAIVVKLRNSSRQQLMSSGSIAIGFLVVLNVITFLLINVFGVFKDAPMC